MTAAIPATPAEAYFFNCGVPGNYFDGMHRADTIEGVSAAITSRYSEVCQTDTGLNNVTGAWSMLADNGTQGWIQSGFERAYGTNLRYFSQYKNVGNNAFSTVYPWGLGYGENHRYWQQYVVTNPDRVRSNVDTTILQTTNFNPKVWWGQPMEAQYFGEVAYTQSDILGQATMHTNFTEIQVQNTTTHAFAAIPCPTYLTPGNDNPDRWSVQGMT